MIYIIFLFALIFASLFPKSVFAAFSFNIKSINPSQVSSKSQEVKVLLEISGLPSESFFRVAWQKNDGDSYFGYLKNDKGEWVKTESLSDDCSTYYKVSQTGDNQLSLSTKIGEDKELDSGNYLIKAHRFTITCKSNEPAGNSINIGVNFPTPTPSLTLTPSPIPTDTFAPTPTSTVSPSPSKATYKINVAKDGDGNILSSVKIYVDGVYIHHLDDQTLTFCSGCHCDDDHNVDCELGQHTTRTEKDGYENWQETRTLSSGDSHEVNPVMAKIIPSSTPTATPVPTSTPIPTPTIKLSLTPTKTPTPSGEVLGEEVVNESKLVQLSGEGNTAPTLQEKSGNKNNFILPAIAIVGGLSLVGFSIYTFLCYHKI